MKPCSQNRKRIAWLALGTLDARATAALREHFGRCKGCRRYWEDISNVTEILASAAPDSNLEASELFHRRVADQLHRTEPSSALENLAVWLRDSMLKWRVALPTLAAVVIALFAVLTLREHPTLSPPASASVRAVSTSNAGSGLSPTLANYQLIASQSLEKLDELLTRQGNKPLPPAPVYTATGLAPNAAF